MRTKHSHGNFLSCGRTWGYLLLYGQHVPAPSDVDDPLSFEPSEPQRWNSLPSFHLTRLDIVRALGAASQMLYKVLCGQVR